MDIISLEGLPLHFRGAFFIFSPLPFSTTQHFATFFHLSCRNFETTIDNLSI